MSRCALAAAATGLPAWFVERELSAAEPVAKKLPATDRPGIALIGCGGMGLGDAKNAARFGEIVAVCDVDGDHADAAVKQLTKDGKAPARFTDFRRLLERNDIHVIVNATPDHWHTLINLAAARTGRDVYGEKPLTLTIDEGRRIVREVRKSGIVFQTGTQQRSDSKFRLACELVRNGRIGKLKGATVWLPAGLREGPFASKEVPPVLNWDFWLGQAPHVDYVPERCHLKFRFWRDYSGGTLTDWGAHHLDIVRWAVGQDAPETIGATVLAEPIPGGFTAYSDYEVNYTWKGGILTTVFTTHDDTIYGSPVKPDGQRNGIRFEGSTGWLWVNRNDIEASDETLISTALPEGGTRLPVSKDHLGNFFECVRSRRLPIADVEVGHRSASVCHLGGIALRVGGTLTWNAERERFTGAHAMEANALVAREMRPPYSYDFV